MGGGLTTSDCLCTDTGPRLRNATPRFDGGLADDNTICLGQRRAIIDGGGCVACSHLLVRNVPECPSRCGGLHERLHHRRHFLVSQIDQRSRSREGKVGQSMIEKDRQRTRKLKTVFSHFVSCCSIIMATAGHPKLYLHDDYMFLDQSGNRVRCRYHIFFKIPLK